MNNKKFKYYFLKSRSKKTNSHEWFRDFMNDKPTLRQFKKLLMGQIFMPEHLWYLSGRK